LEKADAEFSSDWKFIGAGRASTSASRVSLICEHVRLMHFGELT
jgi:hypothetical protein